ncbi:anaphase-promoting complex subunit 4 [Petromyzon marinus]|uniref:anaphase-promoting complex subunit 4 n=1 Tax=Petromyzon marinus TaxID=7757 RepID=UPI003F708632
MPPFRQVAEKQLPAEILHMCWSPKRDLIGLASRSGEVLLHRLSNCQKVWGLPPNDSTGSEVTALAWRPDGKVLAVSYGDTERLVLCDVEKAEILHTCRALHRITCMHWVEVKQDSSPELNSFEDDHTVYLSKLPALPKSEENSDIQRLLGDSRLNILVLGSCHGVVAFYAFGIFKIASLLIKSEGQCLHLCLSSDLKALSVAVKKTSTLDESHCNIIYSQWDTSLLAANLPEVTKMARKFTHISALLHYQYLTVQSMSGAWEDVLIEMDMGLTNFVKENPDTSVSNEFMELLLWGTASPELQMLLLNKLTLKGLKKLGHEVESSYYSILKLLTSHLQSGADALLYHLVELKGMAMWRQKYGCLGLREDSVEEAIQIVGSYMLKADELLHVIENSLKNFKSFFRCLYVAMLHMSDETIPPELSKVSQKELMFVANFLKDHFEKEPTLFEKKGKFFNVDRVGQYLKDELLLTPQDMKHNSWVNFVEKSVHLKDSPLLYTNFPTRSLCQMRTLMDENVQQCLQQPAEVISGSLCECVEGVLFRHPAREDTRSFCLSFWSDEDASQQYTVYSVGAVPTSSLILMRTTTDSTRARNEIPGSLQLVALEFWGRMKWKRSERADDTKSKHRVVDAKFYDGQTLSVLLLEEDGGEEKGPLLAQVPFASVYRDQEQQLSLQSCSFKTSLEEQKGSIPVHVVTLVDQCRRMENMKARFVSVNGIRNVSCVLSSNLRHVRMFEMDVEEEGEAEEAADESIDALEESSDKTLECVQDEGDVSVSLDTSELCDGAGQSTSGADNR